MKDPTQYKPTPKAPAIESFLTSVLGTARANIIGHGKCVFCSDPDFNFRDELSEKEYTITGICQKCQDKTFKKKNSDDTYNDDGVNTKNTFNTPPNK